MHTDSAIDLYWLPLGAGGHSVRLNGRVYEFLKARWDRRPPCDLYHSALQVQTPEGRFVIEQAPVPDLLGQERGVVGGGPVGTRRAGRFRVFRYEIRCWRGGRIPDVAEAVDSPQTLSDDDECARRVLEVVRQVPMPVWGRDELKTGEMWNSNSIIAWTLARSGIDASSIQPPPGGRAPGWRAGVLAAERSTQPPGLSVKGRVVRPGGSFSTTSAASPPALPGSSAFIGLSLQTRTSALRPRRGSNRR